jgi:hypothetical protein
MNTAIQQKKQQGGAILVVCVTNVPSPAIADANIPIMMK